MFSKVKECLSEIIDIAEKCPEKYQVKCFDVLLSALVKPEISTIGTTGRVPVTNGETPVLAKTDFFSKHDISEEKLSQVFAFDGSSCSIIVVDLKYKTKAKQQIKLALLLGIKNLLETEVSAFSKSSLVELCKEYSAHDPKHFAKYMRDAKKLLLPKDDGWILTRPGEKAAADLIKEFAQ